MMLNLSSFFSICALVFTLAQVPAFSQELTETPTSIYDPRFSKYERDLAKDMPDYFTLNPASMKVTLVSVETGGEPLVKAQEPDPRDLAGVLVSLEKIVNIASKIWTIVTENAPVANIESKYATALPEGVTSAAQLASWSKPKTYTYAFYAENMYGAVMIDCKYKVTMTYNGAYKGKGKYLTSVAVIPSMAQVGWGYKFYMNAAVPDSTLANVGTDANPIAAMQLKLNWKMATVLKVVEGTSVYYVQGDGYFEEIASPWKKEKKPEDVKSAAPLFSAAF